MLQHLNLMDTMKHGIKALTKIDNYSDFVKNNEIIMDFPLTKHDKLVISFKETSKLVDNEIVRQPVFTATIFKHRTKLLDFNFKKEELTNLITALQMTDKKIENWYK